MKNALKNGKKTKSKELIINVDCLLDVLIPYNEKVKEIKIISTEVELVRDDGVVIETITLKDLYQKPEMERSKNQITFSGMHKSVKKNESPARFWSF